MNEHRLESGSASSLLVKLLAFFFILICLAVGIVGLILPIIPGLLFLAIAAMIAARHSPATDRWLRKNRVFSAYLDSGRGFFKLNWWGKIQFLLWLCLKIFIDTIVLIFAVIAKLLSFSIRKSRYYQR
tara:strand:- start:357 stop:740 length:384 start_codon:yes stop_codon:yes gene_type:complete